MLVLVVQILSAYHNRQFRSSDRQASKLGVRHGYICRRDTLHVVYQGVYRRYCDATMATYNEEGKENDGVDKSVRA